MGVVREENEQEMNWLLTLLVNRGQFGEHGADDGYHTPPHGSHHWN